MVCNLHYRIQRMEGPILLGILFHHYQFHPLHTVEVGGTTLEDISAVDTTTQEKVIGAEDLQLQVCGDRDHRYVGV